ncbi:MAG: MobF family relaxase [Terracidiphilus sp.]|nr:MobF family relaxase [Terracidiphilus sp.]MDR3799392.1 MobF family relaxase [Terracidiphilus sp.]
MLTISKPLNAGQAQTYHSKEFTSPDQSYWSRGQTVQGEWQGQLAQKFGLSGAVGAAEFARLSGGQHPATGEQLVRHRQAHEYQNADGKTVTSVEHRAGWDATFSVPKSVSLTALVGGDDRVRMAHREAVTAALTELERYTQARIGGNHPAETTGQFVAAKFEHDTARPVDGYAAPQLHTHAVIFNMTERENGQPRALQERGLFESQQFATAVYQSELMYRLRNLGYDIEPGRSGAPEIKGYTQDYLDASSPRSQQIRAHMERNGFEGHESAEIAAHSTRDRKQILSPAEVLAAHRQLAAEFGNQADRVVNEARARGLEPRETPQFENRQMRAQEAVTWARDKVFEREAVGDERGIFRDALRRGMGEIKYPEIRANFEARRATGEFQQVEAPKHASGRVFTTQQVLGAERDVVRMMRDGQNQAPQIMPIQQAIAHTDTYSHLNSGQRRAIEEILVSRDRVEGLRGFAGAGKTVALASVREGAERNGYAVEGFAPTSRAARQLRDAGLTADTLQGFLARGQQMSGDPNNRHLYMVDESSLASTKQMREFLTRIGPQDRVLLIGDTRQHQGVEAGKPFEQLLESGMRTAQLDQIMRQKDPELKAAVERLARGDVAAGIDMLQQQGRVKEIADPVERVRAIARDYAANPENTLIVSPDNASRRQLNDAVRQELQARGIVHSEDHALRVLVPRQELTGAERQWAFRYELDDVIRYTRGSHDAGIERGSYARVVAINQVENLLTVEKQNGEQQTYDPKRLHGVSVYREIEREFSVGDRIQFTAPDKQLQVANRDLAIIEKISPDGEISARLADGRSITFSNAENAHFDHGYAVTSHSSQGLTADRVLVNVDTSTHPTLLNSRFAYVSVSRASHDATLFTDDMNKLSPRLGTEINKTSALEMVQTSSISQGIAI